VRQVSAEGSVAEKNAIKGQAFGLSSFAHYQANLRGRYKSDGANTN
jgi:hypothetical protein